MKKMMMTPKRRRQLVKQAVTKPAGRALHAPLRLIPKKRTLATGDAKLHLETSEIGQLALAAYQGTIRVPSVTFRSNHRVFLWSAADGHTYLGNCRAFYEYLCGIVGKKPARAGHLALNTFITKYKGSYCETGWERGTRGKAGLTGETKLQEPRFVRVK